MIRRLIILLLIVGCEEPSQHGCLDSQACNYDADATIDNNSCIYETDCADVCGGDNLLDNCDVCDADASNDCVQDECGIWDGDSSSCVVLWGVRYNIETTTSLTLSFIQLTGQIPSSIGNLTNLTYLSLYNNQLTGAIPPEIGNLTNLTYLDLGYNQLTGAIPQEVCDLIESNSLNIQMILIGNNLTNTCD